VRVVKVDVLHGRATADEVFEVMVSFHKECEYMIDAFCSRRLYVCIKVMIGVVIRRGSSWM